MKITASAVDLFAENRHSEIYTKQESLRVWKRPADQGQTSAPMWTGTGDWVELSDEAKALQKEQSVTSAEGRTVDDFSDGLSVEDRLKVLLLERIFHIKIKVPRMGQSSSPSAEIAEIKGGSASPGQPRAGWGVAYDSLESYKETEKLSFIAKGVIKTEDGKEIGFEVELKMSRELVITNQISIRLGDAKQIDPLVISFDGTAADLTERKFSFDLDSDGGPEAISFAGAGSGFLTLDLNGDSVVNDGKELFGPITGDGFGELEKYDADRNHWLDENDPVFNKLRIWTKDASGNDVLFALVEKGIGAIYLGSVEADFALQDSQHNLLGLIRKAGVFIREEGSTGTVQQVDLVV